MVLFSGGISVDIDWTTPGVVATEDGEMRLTLDGEPVRTGARIADALLDAGFRVVRYASVPSVPDGADEVVGTPGLSGFAESVDLARLAWARALESCGMKEARAFVVGHSLGAARAALVTERPAGFVTLAGGYLSPRRAPR